MRRRAIVGAVVLLMGSKVSTAPASDTCIEPDPLIPSATLILKSANRSAGGEFLGEFEMENFSIKVISISGRDVSGEFQVDYPDAHIEFKDLNGAWMPFIEYPPGTFLSSPDTLKIARGSKALLIIELFSSDRPELSGADFRVKLRLSDPATCIVSYPFRTYPDRSAITRIESVALPEHSQKK